MSGAYNNLRYLGGGGVAGCNWTILFCDTLYDLSPFPHGINTLTLYLWASNGGSGGAGGIFGTSTSTSTAILSVLIFSNDCDNNAENINTIYLFIDIFINMYLLIFLWDAFYFFKHQQNVYDDYNNFSLFFIRMIFTNALNTMIMQ